MATNILLASSSGAQAQMNITLQDVAKCGDSTNMKVTASPGPKLKIEIKPEQELEQEKENEMKPEIFPEPEPEIQPAQETKLVPRPKIKSKQEQEIELKSEIFPEPELVIQPAQETKSEPRPKIEPEQEQEIELKPEIFPEPEPKIQPAHETKLEPRPKIEPEQEQEIELKPEIFPELEPEIQPAHETKLEPRPKIEPEPEQQNELKPKIFPEPEPEIQPTQETKSEPRPKIEPEQEQENELKPDIFPELEPEIQPTHETKLEPRPKIEPKQEQQNELKPKIFPEPEPEIQPAQETKSEPRPKIEPDQEQENELKSDIFPEPEPEIQPAQETKSEPRPKIEPEQERENELKSEIFLEPEPEIQPAHETKSEPRPKIEPEQEQEIELKPEIFPEPEPEIQPAQETKSEQRPKIEPDLEKRPNSMPDQEPMSKQESYSTSELGIDQQTYPELGLHSKPELHPRMDKMLLKAASSGDVGAMNAMASQDQSILLGKTPQGNTCLHISSSHGHIIFCRDVCQMEQSLLSAVNLHMETPLLAAVRGGHIPLASFLLTLCCQLELKQAILQQDIYGSNALHHAICCGCRELALELIAAEPDLSKHVNIYNESPMFMALIKKFTDVFKELLNIPDSSHAGRDHSNALHAAVRNGDNDTTKRIMGIRPEMARACDKHDNTPVRLAVLYNKIDVLRAFLEHDFSLGYELNTKGFPLLDSAAFRGHIDAAREIIKYCPDAPCYQVMGQTCLHTAIIEDHTEFAEFILKASQLRKVVNMQDEEGKTALHYAVQKCNAKIVVVLLSHLDIDATTVDNRGDPAAWQLWDVMEDAKTLNWNEVCMLMLKADPQDSGSIYNLQNEAKRHATAASRKNAKSLTQTYTSNTSLVAILIVTITFAAAFTLPGGYSNDSESEGFPIMSRKVAFQAFLISDTLAMCSSFAVAFICVITKWEDYEFLIHYTSFTKKLMWFAYVATTTAFSTGLYTVLAPRLPWLAITICLMVALLPILTKLLGEWPILKLRFRLGNTYKPDLLKMV